MRLSINHRISFRILDLKGRMRKRMLRIMGKVAVLILSICMWTDPTYLVIKSHLDGLHMYPTYSECNVYAPTRN
jgi:hypothetical protein